MAFARPLLTTLIAQARADLETQFPGTESGIRRKVTTVLAKFVAGLVHGLYGHLADLAKQIHYDTSDADILVDQAGLFDVQPESAHAAVGEVDLTGADDSPIPAGTVIQREDGVEYFTLADAVIAGGVAMRPPSCASPTSSPSPRSRRCSSATRVPWSRC